MIYTGWNFPQSYPTQTQYTKIQHSATVLLFFTVSYFFLQIFTEGFDVVKAFIQSIGIVTSYFIKNIEMPEDAVIEAKQDDSDSDEYAEEEQKEVLQNFYTFDILINIATLMIIGTIAGVNDCQFEPLIIFSLLILEYITRRFNLIVKYCGIFKIISAIFILIMVTPKCLQYSDEFWTQVAMLASIWKYSMTFSYNRIFFRIKRSVIISDYSFIRNRETLLEFMTKHPNVVLILDRFWTFLVPIPLVIGLWSFSFLKNSSMDPPMLGILTMLAATLIIVKIHWIIARITAIKVSKFMIICLLLSLLIYEAPSNDRRFVTSIQLGLITLLYCANGIYAEIYEIMRSGIQFKTRNEFYSSSTSRIYVESLQRLWTSTSPIISAFIISTLALSSIHGEVRLVLIALCAMAGIFARSNIEITWALIELYVLVEQIYLLFLSQKHFPAVLTDKQHISVIMNVLILIIAESQRLKAMSSIFSNASSINQSRINDSADNSESNEEENGENKFQNDPENDEDPNKPDYDNSLLWWSITKLANVTNVTSLLLLMAVILFYPQFVDVGFQTCLYSLWAFLFTFLFYRSDVTSRLRFVFILILAVLSCSFFIYNLKDFYNGSFDRTIFLLSDDAESHCLLLHGLVFWFSCGALLAMQLESEEIQNKVENQQSPCEVEDYQEEEIQSPVKSIKDSPTIKTTKLLNEAGSFLERAFVVYWTRSCALLAFLAASLNPSIFGAIHLIIGCFLAGKNTLNPSLYVPMILWILCATFFPELISKFSQYPNFNSLLVGKIKSYQSTVCLTLWALTLFLQPVFIKCLKKLTTEKDRQYGLVTFQILPQDDSDSSLSQRNYESFENSTRYYISNWFVEFHNEIMVGVLVMISVSRMNFYGIFSSILACLHVLIPILGKETGLKALASISFSVQMFCFILEYCLSLVYSNYFLEDGEINIDMAPKFSVEILKEIAGGKMKQSFLGLGSESTSIIIKSIFVGMNIILTVRWYLTSFYYEKEKPTRRFDSHWCRLCNQVSFKSMHAYSKVKHNIHLYLGWISHAFLFMTAITAHDQPTIPSVLLLILSLVFFFYGEASILIPKLRNQVYVVLGIILSWVLFNSLVSIYALFGINKTSPTTITVLNYLGMTNIFKYSETSNPTVVFSSFRSRGILGFTVFLILLQIRLYRSKAWPFVLARLYHSYATSAKRARLFHQNLQAAINFQQKNLEKAKEHFRKQVATMKTLDISDWKKLCYEQPKKEEEATSNGGNGIETVLPEYGTGTEEFDTFEDEIIENIEEENSQSSLRKRNVEQIRDRLRLSSIDALQQHKEEELLDHPNPHELASTTLNFNDKDISADSLVPSDESAKKEIQEAENNFYLYTWLSMMRHMAKFIISSAQDYRRLQSRPSKKASMRILFHHQSNVYRIQFFIQMLIDLINANFDFVLDYLVLEAQVFHSSGFSLVMVLAVLLISRAQRPFTNKILHSRMIIFCAAWITFNFCKVFIFKSIEESWKPLENGSISKNFRQTANELANRNQFVQKFGEGFFKRLLGFHIPGKIQDVTWRPTLILLALSYKRSLMRQLGLWDYGKGIQMARNYYQSEEDLDEVGEINVSDNEDNEGDLSEKDEIDSIYSTEISEDDSFENDTILTDRSDIQIMTSWKELIWPSVAMPWRDFYVPMFMSDFVCLFLVVYYWGDFSLGYRKGITNTFLSEMINQNMVPASLVNIVILSTFVLVLDRALYVSKNHLGKLMLQFVTLIGYHIYMFFYLNQFYQNRNISLIWGVKVWYICKWIYWISSALQLKYNYPPLRTESFLGTEYGIVSANLHVIYRNIPFVDELKTIIDWSMTSSALGIWPWLKIADIYERFFAVQCARAFQKTYYGRHEFGMPFNQFSKITQGVIFITAAVLVLWSPFLILSRSWMMTSNTVKSFKLEISLENNGAPFMSFYQDKFMAIGNSKEYENFRYVEGVNPLDFDESFFTKVKLPIGSQVPWQVTEKARLEALRYLKDEAQPILVVKWTIARERPQSHPVIDGLHKVKLSQTEKETLEIFLDNSNRGHMIKVPINNLIPTLLKAPIAENSTILVNDPKKFKLVKVCPKPLAHEFGDSPHDAPKSTESEYADASSLDSSNVATKKSKWGKIRELAKEKLVEKALGFDTIKDECQFFMLSPDGGSEIYIYSNKMPTYNFSSMNFTGLYFTIVLTASQLLKMMHADMTTRIQYDELPNPLPLLIMCQQILMMRELGDFENEEAIYWQLIEILRNPQILIEMTRL